MLTIPAYAANAPNHWRAQLNAGTGLDGLGYASYLLNGQSGPVQANPNYWGNDQNGYSFGSNGAAMVADSSQHVIYLFHPNYAAAGPQRSTVAALGLSPQAQAKLTAHVQKQAAIRGMDVSQVPDIAGWILIVIGVALLLAGIILPAAGFAALAAVEAAGSAGEVASSGLIFLSYFGTTGGLAVGTFLRVFSGVLFVGGVGSELFYPQTSSCGPTCFQNCSIFGCTACDTSQGLNCKPASSGPGDALTGIAIGVAAIVIVGLVGFVAYKAVQSHYAGKGYGAGAKQAVRTIATKLRLKPAKK